MWLRAPLPRSASPHASRSSPHATSGPETGAAALAGGIHATPRGADRPPYRRRPSCRPEHVLVQAQKREERQRSMRQLCRAVPAIREEALAPQRLQHNVASAVAAPKRDAPVAFHQAPPHPRGTESRRRCTDLLHGGLLCFNHVHGRRLRCVSLLPPSPPSAVVDSVVVAVHADVKRLTITVRSGTAIVLHRYFHDFIRTVRRLCHRRRSPHLSPA